MQPTAEQLKATGGKAVEGAWYGNQRYVGGQLLSPNQYAPGKTVSNEVNIQSAKAQGKDPTQFIAYATGQPTSSSSPQDSLNSFQTAASSAMGSVGVDASKSDEEILAEVKSNLEPTTPQPTAPNLESTYQTFLNSPGIGGSSVNQLSGQLTDINKQIADTQSALEAQTTNEEVSGGGKVPLSVIAGRQSEEQRLAQVKLDSLNLQKGVLVDQINMQMQNINTLMQLTEQDYQNASTAWQQEFDVNSKIYDAFTTQVQNRNDLQLKLQAIAATNVQTMMNLITAGNLSYNDLSPDQKLQITQMETQAGLPAGTMSNIQMSAKDKLLNVSNYRGQVTAIIAGPDGQITTQTFGSPSPLGGSGDITYQKEAAVSGMEEQLSSVANSYGNVSPKQWQKAMTAWLDNGFSKKDFIDNFGSFADTNRGDFYSAYGFNNPNKG